MSLAEKLTSERRSRLAAERLLELKKSELFAANRKLDAHARELTEEIVETRAQVETIRGENKRVKSDLSAANQKIAITERRMWHTIETISDGFAFFDAQNKMIMANRAYLAIFDKVEEIRPGVDYVTILQVMTEEGIVRTGDLTPAQWRQMMTRRWQDPQPEPIVIQLWNGNHIKLVDQRGPGGDVVSLGLDITANVVYEEQLKEARQIAESANKAKSAFLANMSHEIRTPMNGVVGMADVLIDTDLSDEQRLYVDTIRNSGEALLVIINDVLDYSKIEAKKLELQPEAFDLEQAIQEILMLLQPSARKKGLSLLLDYDLFLPTRLIGDPGRLRQVMTNLLGNAVKFTSQGHVLVRVVGVPCHGGTSVTLHIAIEDTGIGIPADMVNHIFGEFNQVENERNRQFDGTGLGLAISQRLVEMMDGEIWVTSQEGAGSCFGFKITLDIAQDDAGGGVPSFGDVGRVLVVSDVAATRDILNRQLGKLGLDAHPCPDGATALACIAADVSLVVADYGMSAMDGLAFVQAVQEKAADLPVLLLAQNPTQVEKTAAESALCQVLQFPPPRKKMIEKIMTLLGPQPETSIAPRALRVLAAEDNKTNQLVFRKMVKDLEIDLTFANNGEEAVALYQSCTPDLIFMDISMPKMDGREATQKIRALEKGSDRHVPIVALTAHAMAGDDAGVLAAGLDHYLTKPLRKPDIIEQITAAHLPHMKPLSDTDYGDG
ncbi:response regulator [Sulfitobacter sp. TSTF-M16]|uniref:Sensory/regulatory protein RpfC n=1 Tax=Sulfitobacter aestuariivivens TaxID=2766981 RepID=A0A927D5L7_9RHOB|nr:response regulator [Sulfitobacter aestuariivivens]MBD3665568.1 response regulator [Sulfitobacter aestuariivivens]